MIVIKTSGAHSNQVLKQQTTTQTTVEEEQVKEKKNRWAVLKIYLKQVFLLKFFFFSCFSLKTKNKYVRCVVNAFATLAPF